MATVSLKATIGADARQFFGTMRSVKLVATRTFAALGAIVTGVGIFSVREAVAFEKGMRQVNTMARLSGDEFNAMKKDLQGVMVEFGQNGPAATKALYDAISAGIKPAEAIEFLKVAAEGAAGGATDMAISVDALTTTLNAFGENADQARAHADVMFKVVELGKVTYEELAAEIGKVAPIAASAGMSFQELGGFMAAMLKVEKPERAFTALRSTIALAAKEGKTLEEFMVGFVGMDLKQIMEGGKVPMKQAQGVAILAGNWERVLDTQKQMKDSTGASAAAFQEMQQTASFGFDQLQAALQVAGITIGDALLPTVKDLTGRLLEFVGNEQGVANMATAFEILGATVWAVVWGLERMVDLLNEASGAGLIEHFADKKLAAASEAGRRAIGASELQAAQTLRASGMLPGMRGYEDKLLAETQAIRASNQVVAENVPKAAGK